MMKKNNVMSPNKKCKKTIKEDYGTTRFFCEPCQHHYEVDWEMIWNIQESTHGYIGYDNSDVYMNCPKCGKVVVDN
jgi:predicted RNA-binding Zn-ribbon protein involved in translation (DUF1610 family)